MKRFNKLFTQLLLSVLVFLLIGSIVSCGGPSVEENSEQSATELTAEDENHEVEQFANTIRATGVVVPAQDSALSFTVPGTVAEILVDVGDTVQAGDALIWLDTTIYDAEVAKAEAAVALAEANGAVAEIGPRDEQVTEAEAGAQAAGAGTAIAASSRNVIAAGPTAPEIAQARVGLQQAYITMKEQQTVYEWALGVYDRPDQYTSWQREKLPEELPEIYQNYENALLAYNAAQARLELLLSGANPDIVRSADAETWAASAEYGAAQAQLDYLLALPFDQDLAIVDAAIALAHAGLERAQVARNNAVLTAPYDGVVSAISIQSAQYANVGQPVIQLADLSTLQVKTTDINEVDAARVNIGDDVIVTFDALPDMRTQGIISDIALVSLPAASVTYTITVELDNIPEQVRWGMTAFVEIPLND